MDEKQPTFISLNFSTLSDKLDEGMRYPLNKEPKKVNKIEKITKTKTDFLIVNLLNRK